MTPTEQYRHILTEREKQIVEQCRAELMQPLTEYVPKEIDKPDYQMVRFYNFKPYTDMKVIVNVTA